MMLEKRPDPLSEYVGNNTLDLLMYRLKDASRLNLPNALKSIGMSACRIKDNLGCTVLSTWDEFSLVNIEGPGKWKNYLGVLCGEEVLIIPKGKLAGSISLTGQFGKFGSYMFTITDGSEMHEYLCTKDEEGYLYCFGEKKA